MKFKTATLIALIGMIINLAISLLSFVFHNLYDMQPIRELYVTQLFIQLILVNGSLILFLFVLYRKQ